nr:trichodiene oxygenase [Quercus suber]
MFNMGAAILITWCGKGPIVRVNPDLISIHDPEAYNEIYVGESKRKTENYSRFGQGSHFLTTNHDLHRKRRRPLEPFFSRSGVLRLQGLLGETMMKLEKRLLAEQGTGKVLRLDNVFFAMSGDVVGKLCWRQKDEYLDDPDFAPEWYNLVHSIIKTIYLFQGFPWLARTMNTMPKNMRNWLAPQARAFDDFDTMTLESVGLAKGKKAEQGKMDIQRWEHGCLFDWIINSDMAESELGDMRLANEAQVIQSAGSTSTARTLTHIVYHILANPRIRHRLGDELSDLMSKWPSKVPSWVELENVSYLQACLKEGLR